MGEWQDAGSTSTRCPGKGYELAVTKWARGWGWHIDTSPSAVLDMEFTHRGSRITSMPGGSFLASGTASTRQQAKAAAEAAWRNRAAKQEG